MELHWNPGTLEPAVGLLSWVNLLSGLWRKANFNSNSYWNCLELLDLEILVVFVCDVLSKYTWNDMIKLRCPHLSHQQLQSSLPYPSVYLYVSPGFPHPGLKSWLPCIFRVHRFLGRVDTGWDRNKEDSNRCNRTTFYTVVWPFAVLNASWG
jgi:hypothetical protein